MEKAYVKNDETVLFCDVHVSHICPLTCHREQFLPDLRTFP